MVSAQAHRNRSRAGRLDIRLHKLITTNPVLRASSPLTPPSPRKRGEGVNLRPRLWTFQLRPCTPSPVLHGERVG